jgi:hypothetical protein
MNLNCDVPPDRTVTLKLPDSVSPGRHQIIVVIDAPAPRPAFRELSAQEQSERPAALQARWRPRLRSNDEFACRKEAEEARQ